MRDRIQCTHFKQTSFGLCYKLGVIAALAVYFTVTTYSVSATYTISVQ